MAKLKYLNKENRKLTTDEVRERIPRWMDKHMGEVIRGDHYHKFNEEGAKEYVNELYRFLDLKPPKNFYFAENPREGLIKAREILKDPNYRYHIFFACSVYSTPFWAWHKFIKDNTKPDFKHAKQLDKFYELWQNARIFASILQEDFAVISKAPKRIHLWDGQLHYDEGPALEFAYSTHPMDDCYFWKGVRVPEKLIMAPDTLTKKELAAVTNQELRRCYIDVLGSRFLETLGEDFKVVDEQVDNQGNNMKLVEFEFGGRTVQVLEVHCPTTGKLYNLNPTRICKTCNEAKASTFNDEKLAYRQGDVGLVNLEKEYDQPLAET